MTQILLKRGARVISIIFLVIFFLQISTLVVSAATTDVYIPITNISNILPSTGVNTSDLSVFLANIFKYIIWISSVLAVVMIFIGGFQYATAQALFKKSEAKKNIENALIGLGVVWGAWLLLNTINPQLVGLKITKTVMTGAELAEFSRLAANMSVADQALINQYKAAAALSHINTQAAVEAAQKTKSLQDQVTTLEQDIAKDKSMNVDTTEKEKTLENLKNNLTTSNTDLVEKRLLAATSHADTKIDDLKSGSTYNYLLWSNVPPGTYLDGGIGTKIDSSLSDLQSTTKTTQEIIDQLPEGEEKTRLQNKLNTTTILNQANIYAAGMETVDKSFTGYSVLQDVTSLGANTASTKMNNSELKDLAASYQPKSDALQVSLYTKIQQTNGPVEKNQLIDTYNRISTANARWDSMNGVNIDANNLSTKYKILSKNP
jgi:Type IV secretion system pilin